jgi:excinuclease ABC subunit C
MTSEKTAPPAVPRKVAASVELPDTPDLDPATSSPDEDEDARLPELTEEPVEAVAEGPLAIGHAAIENAVKLAPISPGVYRMLNAAGDVLYVGKAKSVRKRLASYARANAHLPARILRMIAATVNV